MLLPQTFQTIFSSAVWFVFSLRSPQLSSTKWFENYLFLFLWSFSQLQIFDLITPSLFLHTSQVVIKTTRYNAYEISGPRVMFHYFLWNQNFEARRVTNFALGLKTVIKLNNVKTACQYETTL